MRIIKGIDELKRLVGEELGVSDWIVIDQERINAFAEATEDRQWIHVNPEMAKYAPFGTTIAHGFLTLSLLPKLSYEIWQIQGAKMGLNYGTNKVRFIAPLKVNSKLRMRALLNSVEDVEGGVQMLVTATFESEGLEKPICVAESLTRVYF